MELIDRYSEDPDFDDHHRLMISSDAWNHVKSIDVDPKFVFAHPDILQTHPATSQYYRGIAPLSRKRVTGVAIQKWEEGEDARPISRNSALKAARLYNSVISLIIEGSTGWELDDGHRNILATMGITLDGKFRQHHREDGGRTRQGQNSRLARGHDLISEHTPVSREYHLPDGILMRYGSEPDIAFIRDGKLRATIEIKGGTDPAGALERLGAVTKKFCRNTSWLA